MTEAPTLTLIDFLLARIAEDEAVAQAVVDSHEMWDWASYIAGAGMYEEPASEFASRYQPTRALAECSAKRQIVERLREVAQDRYEYSGWTMLAEDPIRMLAAVYADHPDYRPEWRP